MFNKKFDYIIYFVFITLYLTGLIVYSDYGLTLDDEYYRLNGIFFFEYIKEFILNQNFEANNLNIYKNVNMSPSPVFFDLLIASISSVFNLENSKQIYQISHLTNFTIYFIGLIFFFKTLKKLLKNNFLSLLGVLILFLSPRIFAESFYNTRDIFFMSLFIINIYFSLKILENIDLKNIFLFSLITGLAISTRIFAIIPLILIIFLIFMEKIKNDNLPLQDLKKIIFIVCFSTFSIFIFSPYMWANPIVNFFSYFTEAIFSQQQIDVTNLFMGKYYSSNSSPWYFRFIWFFITSPIMMIFFLTIGILIYFFILSKRILILKEDENLWKSKDEFFDIFIFLNIVISIICILNFNKSNVDSWRHLYFLYPLLIYFSLKGILYLDNLFIYNIKRLSLLLIIINLIYTSIWIYKNHPHQQVYFNLASKKFIKNNFDLDYWGLSNFHSFKHILKTTKNFPVKVSTLSFTSLETNKLYLSEDNKTKIEIVYELDNADFLIDNYRPNLRIDKEKILQNYYLFHAIIVDGKRINSIYKKK